MNAGLRDIGPVTLQKEEYVFSATVHVCERNTGALRRDNGLLNLICKVNKPEFPYPPHPVYLYGSENIVMSSIFNSTPTFKKISQPATCATYLMQLPVGPVVPCVHSHQLSPKQT